jgi:hypothetical protein
MSLAGSTASDRDQHRRVARVRLVDAATGSTPCGRICSSVRAGVMKQQRLYMQAAGKTNSAPERDFLAMKAARLRQ